MSESEGTVVPGAAVLDEAMLREITEAAGMTPMELIDMFREDTLENLKAMVSALAEGDREIFNRSAHTLKSSAGNVGAQRVAGLAQALERETKTEFAVAVPALFAQLQQAFDEFNAHVLANAASLGA